MNIKAPKLITAAVATITCLLTTGYLAQTSVSSSLFSKLPLISTMNSTQPSTDQAAMIETIKQVCTVMLEPDVTPKDIVSRFGKTSQKVGDFFTLQPFNEYFDSLQVSDDVYGRLQEDRYTSLEISSRSQLTLGVLKQAFGDYTKSKAPRFQVNSPESVDFSAKLSNSSNYVCRISAKYRPEPKTEVSLNGAKAVRIVISISKQQ
jgi:hypothetical protein